MIKIIRRIQLVKDSKVYQFLVELLYGLFFGSIILIILEILKPRLVSGYLNINAFLSLAVLDALILLFSRDK
jgi:hypothetical protein